MILNIERLPITRLPWWLSGQEATCRRRRCEFELWTQEIPNAAEQLSPCALTTEPEI